MVARGSLGVHRVSHRKPALAWGLLHGPLDSVLRVGLALQWMLPPSAPRVPRALLPQPVLPSSDEESETLPHVLLSPPRISLSVDLTGHWDSEQNTQKCNSLTVPALLFIHFHSLPKVICFLRVLKGNRVFSRLLSSGVILGKLPSLYLRCLI